MKDETVKKDLERSLKLVREKIKPIVEKLLPNWRLMQVEGKDDEVCKVLDMSCGIDYLLYSKDCCLIGGIASRVQYGKNYRTFTVRKERESGALTEFQKRSQAIAKGTIYPYYSMQAYILDENVAGLAITKTADLIKFIDKGFAEIMKTNADKIGQAEFYVCNWDKMKYCGYKVLEYKEGDIS